MTLIKLDIDRLDNILYLVSDLEKRLRFIKKMNVVSLKVEKVCKTKKGYHIYLRSKDKLSDTEIILIQSALGSDWMRELLNLRRVRNGQTMDSWNILFTSKTKKISNGQSITTEKVHDEQDITRDYRFTKFLSDLVGGIIYRCGWYD